MTAEVADGKKSYFVEVWNKVGMKFFLSLSDPIRHRKHNLEEVEYKLTLSNCSSVHFDTVEAAKKAFDFIRDKLPPDTVSCYLVSATVGNSNELYSTHYAHVETLYSAIGNVRERSVGRNELLSLIGKLTDILEDQEGYIDDRFKTTAIGTDTPWYQRHKQLVREARALLLKTDAATSAATDDKGDIKMSRPYVTCVSICENSDGLSCEVTLSDGTSFESADSDVADLAYEAVSLSRCRNYKKSEVMTRACVCLADHTSKPHKDG
jgi:hypothetical protein